MGLRSVTVSRHVTQVICCHLDDGKDLQDRPNIAFRTMTLRQKREIWGAQLLKRASLIIAGRDKVDVANRSTYTDKIQEVAPKSQNIQSPNYDTPDHLGLTGYA